MYLTERRTMVKQNDLKVVRTPRVVTSRADENVALVRVGVEESVQVDHLTEDLRRPARNEGVRLKRQ